MAMHNLAPGRFCSCYIGLRGSQSNDQSGATLVELALVLVLLISLIFGIIEGGRLIWNYSLVANATSEAVRWAAVHGGKSSQPATTNDITGRVVTPSMGLVSSSDVTVSVITSSGTLTWANASTTPGGPAPGSTVVVGASYTFTPIFSSLYPLGSFTMSNSSQMMIAR